MHYAGQGGWKKNKTSGCSSACWGGLLPCCTSLVNLMQLLSGTGELHGIEYFKLVFLKYINVSTWLISLGWSHLYSISFQVSEWLVVECRLSFFVHIKPCYPRPIELPYSIINTNDAMIIIL